MPQPSDDSMNRQLQINEWYYQNKMDTVFALQVTFISICIVSIVFYFKSIGSVGPAFAYYVAVIVIILISILILNRVFFTSARRDPVYWHKLRFNEDNTKVPSTINNVSMQGLLDSLKGLGAGGKPDCSKCNIPESQPSSTGS